MSFPPHISKQMTVFVIGGILCVIVLIGVGLWILRNRYAQGYPIEPELFRNQAKEIKIGMSEDEVRNIIKIYTSREINEKNNKIIYSLEPNEKGTFFRTVIYINIYLDRGKKVSKVSVTDG